MCSDQSFNITYQQKRPELLEEVMKTVSNAAVATIQNKIKMVAIICEAFHDLHMKKWKKKPFFQFDEFLSIENCRENVLTVPIVVDKRSYFIVAAQSAHTYSLLSIPSEKEENNKKRMHKIKKRDDVIVDTLKKCNTMKTLGGIYIETDKKGTYPKILSSVFGKRLRHQQWDAGDPLQKNELFLVNNAFACIRAENAIVRRESWHQVEDTAWLDIRLSIYTVFYNYIRKKKYTRREDHLASHKIKVNRHGILSVVKKDVEYKLISYKTF